MIAAVLILLGMVAIGATVLAVALHGDENPEIRRRRDLGRAIERGITKPVSKW